MYLRSTCLIGWEKIIGLNTPSDIRFIVYPAMMRSEALLIKQWDSAGLLATSNGEQSDRQGDGPCTFSFHSAFDDPENTGKTRQIDGA